MAEVAVAEGTEKKKKRGGKRGPRQRVLPEGDVVVFRRAGKDEGFPDGTLVPYTGVIPQFTSRDQATKWLRENGGQVAQDGEGKPLLLRLAVMKFLSILEIEPEMKAVVSLKERPRAAVVQAE